MVKSQPPEAFILNPMTVVVESCSRCPAKRSDCESASSVSCLPKFVYQTFLVLGADPFTW